MSGWVTSALLGMLLGSLWTLAFVLNRRWQQHESVSFSRHAELVQTLNALPERLSEKISEPQLRLLRTLQTGLDQVQTSLHDAPDRLYAAITAAEPPPAPTGAFLPSEEHVANLEKELARAEDHFISATGPTRYSSMRSASSGSGSRRASSIPPGRPSGLR